MLSPLHSPLDPWSLASRARRCACAVAIALSGVWSTACDSGPTLEESLAAAASKDEELPEGFSPGPKPRPQGLAPPTDAEFKAWNRKDPEGEKHLYKWDKAHLKEMLTYWHELECFREKVTEEGEKAFGAEPGSPTEEQWYQFKRAYVAHVDGWQKRLFAEQPKILEKSKFIGNFLEAHELVMQGYTKAYNDADRTALERKDAEWTIVDAKVRKYTKALGAEFPERDLDDPKAAAQHAAFCEAAMKPPDRSGKAKKRRRPKGAI